MIFSPELARLVVRGKKTMTRRRVKPDENRCRYRVGHDYAVQPGRGQTAIARLVVVDVDMQFLGDITGADARAEGFRNVADFARYWMRLYDRGFDPDEHPDDDAAFGLFTDRHGDRHVWAISFDLDQSHQPRLLRARTRIDEDDYTSQPRNALPDEPEAVDERMQARLTTEAHQRFADSHSEQLDERQARTLARRTREAALAAMRAGIDTSEQLAIIEQQLEIIERKRIAA